MTCGEVMMCVCDEEFARQYLPHQISHGTQLNTKIDVPVTIRFQENVCNACRGLPEESHPMAEIYGRTSKIHRYYWREIGFETIRRFDKWAEEQGYDNWTSVLIKHQEKYKAIEREVVKEIKKLHETNPKYVYHQEKTQDEFFREHNVEVVNLDGVFVKTSGKKAALLNGDSLVSAEEYVINYYQKQGYNSLATESVPFHVLFGVFMWILIQHPSDERNGPKGFGDRNAFERGESGEEIWTIFPDDFGTSGYYQRRKNAVDDHLKSLPDNTEELLWLFEYWIDHSSGLRQYLWAHKDVDVEKARKITSILPPKRIKTILEYLVEDYWNHYLGWPDLFLYKDGDYFFAEVKASKDRLSNDQKTWIRNNDTKLKLPFKLVKIHRKTTLDNLPVSTPKEPDNNPPE